MKKLLFTVAASFLSTLFLIHPVQAEDKVQITMSPISENIELEPGKTYKKSLTVYNSGSVPYKFVIYASPYTIANESYAPIFGNETEFTQVHRWVQFTKDTYELLPGKTLTIPYSIVTPASIPDGGQYGAIFAETVGEQNSDILTKKRVGMILYTQAKGHTKSAGMSKFDSIGSLQSSSSIDLTTRIINTGNIDFSSTVSLTVSDYFSKKMLSTTSITKPVLPGTTRALQLHYNSSRQFNLYRVTQTAAYLGKRDTATTTILVVSPLLALVAVLVVIALAAILAWIILLIRIRLRKRKHARTLTSVPSKEKK